jgi:hypothetical protein
LKSNGKALKTVHGIVRKRINRSYEGILKKQSEREKIESDSRKKFTILVDKVSNKEQYVEVDDLSENNR